MDTAHQIHSIVKENKKGDSGKGLVKDLYVSDALRNWEHLCLMGWFGVVESTGWCQVRHLIINVSKIQLLIYQPVFQNVPSFSLSKYP